MPIEVSPHTEESGQRGIGVVAPFDFALDRELWRWVPDDISLYLTRMPFLTTQVTVEMAVAVGDHGVVRRATKDVLTPEPDVVTYACASGSFINGRLGERDLTRTILDAGAPAARTTAGSLVEALTALGSRKLAIATPYIEEITVRLDRFLLENGIRTVASGGMGLLSHIWRVPYSKVVEIVSSVDTPEADALFISCTNLPTYDVIGPLEQALGKPVITANQVTMWSALRAMGRSAVGAGQSLLHVPALTPAPEVG
ncbi:maleate cis-trans isomerase family protein [Pseudonocardia spinosispora]|uniref:maleate cis-trans isomerase family protein n=1 Tax=Pseudonocardia spinosispora TaxID=103441 RepID=UPI00041AC6D1|nr:Asp/Glu racemase [Pseudonocardia spinosispora]